MFPAMNTEIDDIVQAKQRMRLEVRAHLAAMNPEASSNASQRICARLADLFQHINLTPAAGPIAAFLPTAREPAIEPFIERLAHDGFELMVPGYAEGEAAPHFLRLEPAHALARSPQGFRAPMGAQRRDIAEAAVILVPGLAFARDGRRLGKGGGWYDRALAGTGYRVGIAFGCQLIDAVPGAEHDQRVDAIVTEDETIVVHGWTRHA